jgi:uncharacterized protein
VAREQGLEPLAQVLLEQKGVNTRTAAAEYVDAEKSVADVDAALAGARDIIAEIINEDKRARAALRHLFFSLGIIRSRLVTGKGVEGKKYSDYFDWQEPVASAPSHRILAMRRGEKEDILNISIFPPEDGALKILEDIFVKGDQEDSAEVRAAVHDGYKRLLSGAMETEVRLAAKERADTEAIRVFSENLRDLLLYPPLGAKRVMGIDPGYRTGCKLVCLDPQGKLEHHETIYPHSSQQQSAQAAGRLRELIDRYQIEAIAVGNGTAGRETEAFVKDLNLSPAIQIVMVNESGASIYSASETARLEFPDLDLTVRGAISIARRLMDPLSELVKIDPKSIGVGQYQHDVDQSALKSSLDDVVTSCVNRVGVEVNQASPQLLTYISGLGPQLARNIVAYREKNGPFTSRMQLRNVPRLGPKAFQQSAGFIRIRNAENPLDASAVHPESYHVVAAMARDVGGTVEDLLQHAEYRQKIDVNRYVDDQIGAPTLRDILAELAKPGRDPRRNFEAFTFASDVQTISDLKPGMKIPGVVTNVTAFGAFVDVGVHQDGLVHISQLADRYVKNAADIVHVQQKVNVTVLEVDLERNRISLSLKRGPRKRAKKVKSAPNVPMRKTPPKTGKPQNRPFHNPFADILSDSSNG